VGYRQMALRGDYGYYRGDPGFLSSAFKGVVGAVKGGVRSLVTGGNPIAGAVAGATSALRPTPVAVAPSFSMAPGQQVPRVLTGLTPGTAARPAMVGMSPMGTVGVAYSFPGQNRGYHMNRSTYYTRAGRVEKGTTMVRNRHANYGNGRALKRALARAHGFQHLARAVMSFTLTGKKYTRPHFKAARRGK